MRLVMWMCAGFVLYAYAGYPLILWMLARAFGRRVQQADIEPPVTFIIAARNEGSRIAGKIENTLALDYPPDLCEVIVASDHSDDGTNSIVESYATRGVRLVVSPERRGKEFAQSLAISSAKGEIFVFSDVSTILEREGLRRIVRNFADHQVGCVSSVDRVLDHQGRPSGEGVYIRYEMLLRSLESRVGSVVGLSGSFFAARREVCTPWPVDLPSDFNTLLNTLRLGMRGVSDPEAVGLYPDLAEPRAEYARKVRTITRGLNSLRRNRYCLNPMHYGLAAWQLFSHKLCRWLVPFALLGLATTNFALASESLALAILAALQAGFYGLAGFGLLARGRLRGPARLAPFFVLVNVSILNAWYRLLCGRKSITWQPSRR